MGNCEENKQEKKKLEDYVRSIPGFSGRRYYLQGCYQYSSGR